MGYLFCTMSSTEIIGSLITFSLWSRLEGQAHQGIETGASVYSHGRLWSPAGRAPGARGMAWGFCVTQRQARSRKVVLPSGRCHRLAAGD